VHRDITARLRERDGDRLPHAATRAGDERGSAVEPH
jgi:hypothetical protein